MDTREGEFWEVEMRLVHLRAEVVIGDSFIFVKVNDESGVRISSF